MMSSTEATKPKRKRRNRVRVRKECSHEDCPNKAVNGGVCIRHGAKKWKSQHKYLCTTEGCTALARVGGVCIRHGSKEVPKKLCKIEGCIRQAITVREGLCIRHGAKRKKSNEFGYICKWEGCANPVDPVKKRGLCITHGAISMKKTPKKICSVEGCTRGSRGKVGTCIRHGAVEVPICKVEGCASQAITVRDGVCVRHGGRKQKRRRKNYPPDGVCINVPNADESSSKMNVQGATGGEDKTVAGLIINDYSSSSEEEHDSDDDSYDYMQLETPADEGKISHSEKDSNKSLSLEHKKDVNGSVNRMDMLSEKNAEEDIEATAKETGEDKTSHAEKDSHNSSSSDQHDDANNSVSRMGIYSEKSAEGDDNMTARAKKTGEDEISRLEKELDCLLSEEEDDYANISVDEVDMDSEVSEGDMKTIIKKYEYSSTGKLRRLCNYEGCKKRARGREGVCIQHGARMQCIWKGCTNHAYSKRMRLCGRHKKENAVKEALPVPNDHYDFMTTCTCFSKSSTFCGMHDRYPLDENDAKSGIKSGETKDDNAVAKVRKPGKLCKHEDCTEWGKFGGFCRRHCTQFEKLCNYEGCTKFASEAGLCSTHHGKEEEEKKKRVASEDGMMWSIHHGKWEKKKRAELCGAPPIEALRSIPTPILVKPVICEREGCIGIAKIGLFCHRHAIVCNHEGCTNKIPDGEFCHEHGADLREDPPTHHLSEPTLLVQGVLCEYKSCKLRTKSGIFCEFHAPGNAPWRNLTKRSEHVPQSSARAGWLVEPRDGLREGLEAWRGGQTGVTAKNLTTSSEDVQHDDDFTFTYPQY